MQKNTILNSFGHISFVKKQRSKKQDMYSKKNSDKARIIVNTILLDNEVAAVLKKMKTISKVTYEHSLNVAFLVAEILVPKSLSEDEIITITEGAMLHDIGKLKIPLWLLEKNDFLTPEEREIIKLHPKLGLEVLSSDFSTKKSGIIKNIISMHHETLDGTGYPYGLKDKEIPWYVKLVNVVDSYEAMTAERNYGKAYSREDTIEILKHNEYPTEYIWDILQVDIN